MYESGEMYLETILILKKKQQHVRSVDIANALGFSKPSVSRAVGILREDGYIVVDEDGFVELTDEGKKVAAYVYEKHVVLTEFFSKVANVPENIAEEDACKIEHVISDETFQALKALLEKKSNA